MDAALIQEIARVESEHWWFQSRASIACDYIRRRIAPAHNSGPLNILDVGAGTGLMAQAMAPLGRVCALEAAPAALEALRAKTDIERLESLLPNPDIESNRFDLVTSFDVIEHIDEDRIVLDEMARILRPGGHLLLTVPAHPFLWTSHDDANEHKRRYTKKELKTKVREAGLDVAFFSGHLSLLFPAFLAQRLLMRASAPESPADVVAMPGRLLNSILNRLYSVERLWLSRGIPAPVGASYLVHARKPVAD